MGTVDAPSKPSPEPPATAANTATQSQLDSSPKPTAATSTPDPPSATDSKESTPTPTPLNQPPRPPDSQFIHIPSYSRWFLWNSIHECEVRNLPEFFDGRSPSKNPRLYKYYRNTIIRRFRENPTRKITFTDVRKTIIGDVGSIRRVFDFLETWGLINYAGAAKPQLKWEEKESKSAAAAAAAAVASQSVGSGGGDSGEPAVAKKRLCSACKSVCSIACFACDKYDLTLCARCFVRGNYRLGLNSSDFRRVEINEDVKTDWTDKETLQLLEALMHYGDDWKKVAGHVGSRSEKECIARFIKLPFGEQFVGPPESARMHNELEPRSPSITAKRMQLTPLADASNPIMAQAAFLSTLAGAEVSELAAQAAVKALSALNDGQSLSSGARPQETDAAASNGNNFHTTEGVLAEANLQLDKEEQDLENAISNIAFKVKEMEDKIFQFEKLDEQTERERQQLEQLKNHLFVDQLTLLFHKTAPEKIEETKNTKDDVNILTAS